MYRILPGIGRQDTTSTSLPIHQHTQTKSNCIRPPVQPSDPSRTQRTSLSQPVHLLVLSDSGLTDPAAALLLPVSPRTSCSPFGAEACPTAPMLSYGESCMDCRSHCDKDGGTCRSSSCPGTSLTAGLSPVAQVRVKVW